jgi:GTPase
MFENKSILLADTAGLRKKKYIDNRIEKSSLRETKKTIDYSNTVILVVDAQMPLTHEDLQIASMVEKEGRSLVIAANKWDLITDPYAIADRIETRITKSLTQIKGVSVVVTSALTGKNLELLIRKAIET